MTVKTNLARLILQAKVDGIEYRLIGVARSTPGYTDRIVIERASERLLGDISWHDVDSIDVAGGKGDNTRLPTENLLALLLLDVIKERNKYQRELLDEDGL